MAAEGLVCGVCGSAGFLINKLAVLPFVLGVALGALLPEHVWERLGLRVWVIGALSRLSQTVALHQARVAPGDCGGLDLDDLTDHVD